jgi:hypothetical protein
VSLLSVLKTIGDDIEKGIAVATPIVGGFNPAIGIILGEASQVIAALESQSAVPDPSHVSTVIQSIATASTAKQAAAAALAPISVQISKGQTITVGA